MVIIEWNETFSTNVDEIDKQHRHLIDLINELAQSMADGRGRTVIGTIIDKLVDYTKVHFRTEERIFTLVEYPETKSHVKEHADFIRKIMEFRDGFKSGRIGLTVEVMNFLCDWARNHIKKSDKHYAAYIADQGPGFSSIAV